LLVTHACSGVLVVQSREGSDEHVLASIKALFVQHRVLTATSLASLSKVSAVLAVEQLLTAERAGVVCRDETIEGLRFFPNRFLGA